jgi:hypothetical protein
LRQQRNAGVRRGGEQRPVDRGRTASGRGWAAYDLLVTSEFEKHLINMSEHNIEIILLHKMIAVRNNNNRSSIRVPSIDSGMHDLVF